MPSFSTLCLRCYRIKPDTEFTVNEDYCDECIKKRTLPPKKPQRLTARPRDMFRATGGKGQITSGHFEGGKKR